MKYLVTWTESITREVVIDSDGTLDWMQTQVGYAHIPRVDDAGHPYFIDLYKQMRAGAIESDKVVSDCRVRDISNEEGEA